METLLILLGVMGLGAIIIAIHLFSVDAEGYGDKVGELAAGPGLNERKAGDRRSGQDVVFPLVINSVAVHQDRRLVRDRRHAIV